MGYCISMTADNFCIDESNLRKALKAIQALAENCQTYSWINQGFEKIKTFEKMMDEWRYPVAFDDDGNVNSIEFCGEKIGDDMDLWNAIAPYVKADSYIEMIGEDGDRWRWMFNG